MSTGFQRRVQEPVACSIAVRWLRAAEDGLTVLVLSVLMALPLLEVLGRKLPALAITGSGSFGQHFTLLVGVLGGALAAREGRLLSLSSLSDLLGPRGKMLATIFSNSL